MKAPHEGRDSVGCIYWCVSKPYNSAWYLIGTYKCVLNGWKGTKNGDYGMFLSGGFHLSDCLLFEGRNNYLIEFYKHVDVLENV